MSRPQSVGAMLKRSVDRYPDKIAQFNPFKGKYKEVTYAQLWDLVTVATWRLHERGLTKGSMVSAYSDNCFGWAVLDWACFCMGIVLVPIYPTLPGDQAAYIVNDSGSKLVYVGGEKFEANLAGKVNVPIIPLGTTDADLEHHIEKGRSTMPADWPQQLAAIMDGIHERDVATIIYTSGTTGNPKGAVLPHLAFTHLCENVQSQLPVGPDDRFLAWLPLSHVYERFAGHVLPMALGGQIARSQGLASLASEMMQYQPTIMLCVPRFLASLMDRITDAALKQGGLKAKLFELALAQGRAARHGKFAPLAGLLDRLVGAKVREKTGGRLKFFVSGGGALPLATSDFFRALGIEVLQGYGLTETCAATTLNHPDRNRPETIGEPFNGMEIRVADDGELLVRGPAVMLGYHNLPEATAEAIDSEGWFHTGDIGVQDGNYYLITDRKKDLIVLGNGKNVAPQPIENKLRECPHIKEAALFGDGMNVMCGLIVPNFERLEALAKEQGIAVREPKELVALPAVRSLIKREIDTVNQSLADYEKVRKFEILTAEFSVETGELTPSLKVRRKVVREKYRDLIDQMA